VYIFNTVSNLRYHRHGGYPVNGGRSLHALYRSRKMNKTKNQIIPKLDDQPAELKSLMQIYEDGGSKLPFKAYKAQGATMGSLLHTINFIGVCYEVKCRCCGGKFKFNEDLTAHSDEFQCSDEGSNHLGGWGVDTKSWFAV
jgi:hypothetical protein